MSYEEPEFIVPFDSAAGYDARFCTRVPQSGNPRLPSRPFCLQGGGYLLSCQLLLPVLPRSAHIPEQGHDTLAADRQCARPREPTAPQGGQFVARHLCPYHPLPRRHLLYDNHQCGQRRQLPGYGQGPARSMERPRMAEAAGHRSLALFREREVLHGQQSR